MLKPRYSCYVTLPGTGETEFFPLNDTAVFGWTRDNDIWRKKIDTTFLISNHGGLSLYDIMAGLELNECECHTLPMRITIKCPGDAEETLFEGIFNFIDGEWHFDSCHVEIEPRTDDPFTCLFRYWEKEKNILEIEDNVILSTDLGTFQIIECTASYAEDFPGSPSRKNTYEDDCLSVHDGGDWQVLSHEVSQDDPENDLFVRTRWIREVFNGAGPPLGHGWNQVDPTFWTRLAILQGPEIQDFAIFFMATWTNQSKILDNGRLLQDVLQFLVSDCPYPFQSDYLGINPDGTAPVNDAYTHAQEWIWDSVLFSMSDVVKNDASENATKAITNLKDLWEGLKIFSEAFLFFDEDNSTYRIEHISYKRLSKLINLVAKRPEAIRGFNTYTYDKVRIPKKETYSWGHPTSKPDWDTASIEYSDCSEEKVKPNQINVFHTDFGSLVGSGLKEIDVLKGLMLVSQYQGQINRGIGAISGTVVANAGLSWANMVAAVWKWNRPECFGTVNGVANVMFESLMYKIRQIPFSVEMGCYCKDILMIDPNICEVRTGLGNGIIDNFEIDLASGLAEFTILHAPPITLIDETVIIPEFFIIVNDDTQCYYTDFIFSLSHDLNNLINVEWDFGVGAIPPTATGEGPQTVQYTSAGVKTITVTASYEGLEYTASINVTVAACPGNITGTVKRPDNSGVGFVNIKLFKDTNLDGIADDAIAIKSVNTAGSGTWSMASVVPGSYVIVLTLAGGITMVSAADTSPDGDLGVDISPTDNVIPVTITPSKLDNNNNFIVNAP